MEIMKRFTERAGKYSGRGVNHDNQEFTGELTLTPIIEGKGVEVSFAMVT